MPNPTATRRARRLLAAWDHAVAMFHAYRAGTADRLEYADACRDLFVAQCTAGWRANLDLVTIATPWDVATGY